MGDGNERTGDENSSRRERSETADGRRDPGHRKGSASRREDIPQGRGGHSRNRLHLALERVLMIAPTDARFPGCAYALANAGHDTRALQAWLGQKHPAHGALHRVVASPVQGLLALRTSLAQLGRGGFSEAAMPHYRSAQQRRFPESFVREIEERFSDCFDTDHSAGRGNGMSGIVAGKQPNEAERVYRGERAPRRGLDGRPNEAASLDVLAGTRSDRRCLVERSGFGVRCR